MRAEVFMGKQIHAQRLTVNAVPHGAELCAIPRKAFVFDILYHLKHPLPLCLYGGSLVSVGIPGNKEYVARGVDVTSGDVIRAPLGPGAGLQEDDALWRIFWLYTGKGQPSSGLMTVCVVYDLT